MAIRLAELMGLLHEAGYIMPDCKPDNFLWIEKISRMTLFDADTILQYSEGIQPEALFFDSVYISPEIDRLRHTRNIGWSQMRRVLRPASDLRSTKCRTTAGLLQPSTARAPRLCGDDRAPTLCFRLRQELHHV